MSFKCIALLNSGNRITKNLRDLVFRSIIRQEIAFFDKVRTGELINRLSTDTTIVGTSVTMNISDGLRSVTQAIGGITMMVCRQVFDNNDNINA